MKDVAEQNEKKHQELLQNTYSSLGDIFHNLHFMLENSPSKYLPLITALGDYVRCMYTSDGPLSSLIDNFFDPEQFQFQGLSEEENRQMMNFLKEIKDNKRNPVDLLRLIEELTNPETTFKAAFVKIKSSNNK